VVTLLGEDGDGRMDDPISDLLFLSGGESGHVGRWLQNE
jgi:hypothetical protein